MHYLKKIPLNQTYGKQDKNTNDNTKIERLMTGNSTVAKLRRN